MAGLTTDTDAVAAQSEAIIEKNELELEKKGGSESLSESEANDGIHEGLVFPTEEEQATLRRVSDTIPWAAYLIATVELAERFSFYGSSVVFTNFIQRPLPNGSHTGAGGPTGQSGALGRGQATSTGLGTFYQFWCYVTPLIGAYIADEHLGRYTTVNIGVVIAFIGHIVLIISAVPGVIEKSQTALGVFVLAQIIIGFGTGLFKSNISPLVAEQYRRTKSFIKVTGSGERVIVDPIMTISRMYMYFYLFINVGALIGQITMVYAEKYVGFYLAYTLPTVVFLLCPIILVLGRSRYHTSPPTGSVFATFLQLVGFAAKPCLSANPVTTFKQLSGPQFWEAAKPSSVDASGRARPKWMTFDDQWVDEVRRGVKACWVFLWFPLYWLTYNQLNNNLTSQAAEMETHGLPNDVLSNLDPLALIILIPICDQFIYPALKRNGIKFTALKKIAWGFFTGSAAMIWAAVVQAYIYKTNPCGNQAATCTDANDNVLVSPLNVWIQSGAYILIAISEIFASITGLEYAFTKAPKNMRSLVMSIFLFMSALSAAIGEAFVTISNDPFLVWNYGSMGVIAFIAGILFWLQVRSIDSQEDELNALAEGHLGVTEPGPVPHNEKV